VIAFTYGLRWQEQLAIRVAAFAVTLGTIHEYSETFAHHHAREIANVLVNSIDAEIGVVLERAFVPAKARA